jgi:ribonucleoside-diphosphate reductase alpha chain
MDAIRKNSKFDLINPRTRRTVKSIKARVLFDLIVYSTWRTGDPGLIFLDEINRRNPTPRLGRIEATNPCGEIPLLPNESCNLASINLSKFERNGSMEWDRLEETIAWGVRFLDDVIEVNSYPLPQIREMTFANRKIGLGVMGFADMLIKLGIPYNEESAIRMALKVMKFVREASWKASQALARERGVFPNHKESIYPKKNMRMRNATVNTVAPTGTISIIASCSSGIEPLFALSFVRNVLSGSKLYEVHSLFEEELRMRSLYSRELLAEVGKVGSIQDIQKLPADIRKIFVTAFDVPPEHHLRIQAAFQKYTDNSVSKTINLPFDSTVEDVRKIYMLAHELKCKGITIYRYDTKKDQVLTFDSRIGEEREELLDFIMAGSEYAGGCHSGMCPF